MNPHIKPHEAKTVRVLLTGATYREIADELGISEHAVCVRLNRVMERTGARNRLELALMVLANPQWIHGKRCESCGRLAK